MGLNEGTKAKRSKLCTSGHPTLTKKQTRGRLLMYPKAHGKYRRPLGSSNILEGLGKGRSQVDLIFLSQWAMKILWHRVYAIKN